MQGSTGIRTPTDRSPNTSSNPRRASLTDIARTFGTIAVVSFGGGQKAAIRRAVVEHRVWLSDDDFIEALALAELMPGANLVNLAVFIGHRLRGVRGAVVALLAVCIPPFAIALGAAYAYFARIDVPLVGAALRGCAAAAVGLTIANAIELTAERRRDGPLGLVLLAATAVAVGVFKLGLLPTFALFGGLGIWLATVRARRGAAGSA
ncbi:MAG: chromate transporter [Candidatus Eremiobacteraeota bacterium]|nr:chromate transporter [Candidatus Eremiobacteraeota bacterium]